MSKLHYAFVLALAVTACGQNTGESGDTSQTTFPGQFSAKGGTSGDVMAKNGRLQAKQDALGSPVLVPAQADSPKAAAGGASAAAGSGAEKPAGTPGIPGGSEGNVSGTAMGGTTPDAAKSEQPQTPKPAADAASKEAEAKAKAEKEKQQLEASMDAVAQRWRSVAGAQGWQLETAADAGSSGVSAIGETQTSAIGLPAIIRSEKLGTAPPSEDVKDPAKEPTN